MFHNDKNTQKLKNSEHLVTFNYVLCSYILFNKIGTDIKESPFSHCNNRNYTYTVRINKNY